MKKTGILILAVAFIAMSFTNQIPTIQNTLKVDVTSSTITWSGYKPTGSHTGTIMLQSGTLAMQDEYIIGGSFIADMSSIKDADGSAKLEGHLKSADFFEIETYPTATFNITEVEMEDGNAIITGNMTIKGITKEISFEAEISETEGAVTLMSSVFQINRADFNVKYKSKTFFNDLKDKFVNDEFDLQVTLVANK
ncbi:polyisoprenoid-binding protein YceI [Lutibacter oceani]|uniref:Polyisoprenoid-binding protein YceI n=1 Tax=Lutibacter oceani TaxID=1853311 RepID=A0A3D9RUM2_9FLAO|nr:YceI family protein [Lutibacter oceani]REE83188.1 polyisoprenoid-binding protein YceI [Lutibacter oceani]